MKHASNFLSYSMSMIRIKNTLVVYGFFQYVFLYILFTLKCFIMK